MNSDTCTEGFLLGKKRKAMLVHIYLKDDSKTREIDGTFIVCVLWPYFLEHGGTQIIRFNILDHLIIFRTGIGGHLIRRFLCTGVYTDCVYRSK